MVNILPLRPQRTKPWAQRELFLTLESYAVYEAATAAHPPEPSMTPDIKAARETAKTTAMILRPLPWFPVVPVAASYKLT